MARLNYTFAGALLSALMMAPSINAMETEGQKLQTAQPVASPQAVSLVSPTSNTTANLHISQADLCAIGLMPIAQNIFYTVSPKVDSQSNLRKLVKKAVKPKVFSGKLSVKSARESAAEASVCLKILKEQNQSFQ